MADRAEGGETAAARRHSWKLTLGVIGLLAGFLLVGILLGEQYARHRVMQETGAFAAEYEGCDLSLHHGVVLWYCLHTHDDWDGGMAVWLAIPNDVELRK